LQYRKLYSVFFSIAFEYDIMLIARW